MYRYILKRLLLIIPVIIGVSFLVYSIIDLAPGDVIGLIASEDATHEEIEALREEMGLNKPLVIRYIDYMKNLLKGDLGTSYINGQDVYESYMQ